MYRPAPDEALVGSEAYPRLDCWRNAWRGKVRAVLRAVVLNAAVACVEFTAARANVRAVEAIEKLFAQAQLRNES